ncbi:hypothetical protein VSR68_18795 [Paraburkholderia phymatum]|uniref:hypothetical protein n=1 Tax=Paraburkholderia phymatum TaxID=148447 RepID=UPI0031742C17
MERRTFIAAGAWLSATAAWRVPWFHADGLLADIALIDTSLPESAALSAHAAHVRLPAFDINDAPHADIAVLWYEALAPRAAQADGRLTLIGVTRAADFFVLARLALQPGAALAQTHAAMPAQEHSAAVAFALTT